MTTKPPCPTCKGKTKHHYEVGLYCTSCGLILSTYKENPPANIKSINPHIRLKGKRCFGCETSYNLSRHHIIPKRLKKQINDVVILCKGCHRIADRIATIYYNEVKIETIK